VEASHSTTAVSMKTDGSHSNLTQIARAYGPEA